MNNNYYINLIFNAMKQINLLITIILLSSITIKAQGPNPPQFNPKEMAAQTILDLTKQIAITPAIQDSLNITFIAFFTEMKKGQESRTRPDMEKIEASRDLKVKRLLTEEQFKIYQKFMEEKKPRRGGPEDDRMHNRPEGRR
jgi:periplasmic protein CpxP/Spy